MNEELPDPPLPADVDLTGFDFMPLDVQRLTRSDLARRESPEACWGAVLLWCESWHQVPAASLPDDDAILASLAGYGRDLKRWAKVKSGAMRGWLRYSDGRLYHLVVAEKALEAWLEKLAQRISGNEGNAKRWGMTFDRAPQERAMQDARIMLARLNPDSRALTKRRTAAIGLGSGGDRVAIGSGSGGDRVAIAQRQQRDSRQDRKGQGQGQGHGGGGAGAQACARQPQPESGADECATTTTLCLVLNEQPPEIQSRLKPLVTLGIEIDKDLPGWIRRTDGLTPEQVMIIIDTRSSPIEWSSGFNTLRKAWEDKQRRELAAMVYNRDRKTQDEATALESAAKRKRDHDREAKAKAEAEALEASLATPMGSLWPDVINAVGSRGDDFRNKVKLHLRGSWPVGCQEGVLEIHCQRATAIPIIEGTLAPAIIAASERLGCEVRSVRATTNGYSIIDEVLAGKREDG